jgi:hypothetical protein
MITIDELIRQLSDLSLKLESAPDDAAKFDLEMLVLELRKQTEAQAFDPLAALAGPGVEVDLLKVLIPQVDLAIITEQKRVMLVERIILLAKSALGAAGVPLIG